MPSNQNAGSLFAKNDSTMIDNGNHMTNNDQDPESRHMNIQERNSFAHTAEIPPSHNSTRTRGKQSSRSETSLASICRNAVGVGLVVYGLLMMFINVQIMNRTKKNSSGELRTQSVKAIIADSLQNFVQPLSNDNEHRGKEAVMQHDKLDPESQRRILTAYLELPWTTEQWNAKPLVPRNGTSKEDLKIQAYPQLASCRELPSQFPIDNSPCEDDPFLPWIHDVFPSPDGSKIQVVAQNKRRCNTGEEFSKVKAFFQPQVALFQSVPIKRIPNDGDSASTRYKLVTSHEQADEDGVETRFICKFQPSGLETLSRHNVNYDWHTIRKGYKSTFTEVGFDVHMIWSSQLMFYCPVPPELQQQVASGETVHNDYATLYFDLIPIRTKPRYGHPTEFLPPKYLGVTPTGYNATLEWGEDGYILPEIESSGRWANIPICRPPLKEKQLEISEWENKNSGANRAGTGAQRGVEASRSVAGPLIEAKKSNAAVLGNSTDKPHRLVACTWTSVGFKTRGDASTIRDGPERLKQWIEFHLLSGFDHMYIFDNSGHLHQTQADAEDPELSLAQVTDQFSPRQVTRINWPSKICNNNKSNSKNKGERSSQYAAETSCMLRYGPHTDWIGNFDTDEYLVPFDNRQNPTSSSLKRVLDTMDEKGDKILTFRSQRAWPRLNMIEYVLSSGCVLSMFDIYCNMGSFAFF
jgi:hypothetical protein